MVLMTNQNRFKQPWWYDIPMPAGLLKTNHTDIAYLSEMDKVNVLHQVLSDFVRNLQGSNN